MKKAVYAVLFLTIFGLALQKVFSLSLSGLTAAPTGRVETQFLLSQTQDILPDAEAKKVIRSLEEPIAREYQVRRSDWLEKVAKEFGVPAIFIRSTNNLEDPAIRPGQEIIVHNKKGMVHRVRAGESLDGIAQAYEKLGGKRESILAMNPLEEFSFYKDGKFYPEEGSLIWIPGARRSFPFLFRPVAWRRISSSFGYRRHPLRKIRRFHDGFDMVAPQGSPVHAGESGVVTFAGWQGGYGNMVEIRHAKITTRYGHLSKILVEPGQKIKRKQLIGRVGSTGISTGPHLHFEVRRNSDGKAITPRKYLF